jgi:hypothetical protein
MKKRTFSTLLFILTAPWFLTGQPGNGSAKRLDCLAHYISFYDSINPSLVNFYDVSIGNPDSWYWNFGDPESGGDNTSKLQNPLHMFTSSGNFLVCLTITNSDTLHPCLDTFCDTISIDLTYNCHAYFYENPDTANPVPNTVKFLDRSTGSPNHFQWNFGDGTTSDLRNPQHHFSTSGDYNVCLKIIRSDSTGILCTDSICKQVNVVNYYELGGHAFAGLFPINNPVSTGDTGIAYLYQFSNYVAALKDSSVFFYLGYFTFPHTPEGQYLVKVLLKPTSTHYQNYLATYFPDALQQENAQQINLSDSNIYNADIHLHALNPGIFEIGGADEKIMISDPYPDPASEIICLNIRSTADLRLKVNVYSVIGQEMLSLDFNISAGLNTARIPVGSIPEGMYFIVPGIQDGSISTVRKFLKR